MDKERKTKLSNEIIFNILSIYNTEQIKILTTIINRLTINYHVKSGYDELVDYDEISEIRISKEYFDKFRGRKKISIKDMRDTLVTIQSMGILIKEGNKNKAISLIEEVEYCDNSKVFTIVFNRKGLEYLCMIKDNFTLVDLQDLKGLNGKYEVGIYLLTQMYLKNGFVNRDTDWIKEYFATEVTTSELKRLIEKAITKLESKLDYDYNLEFKKKGKSINMFIIKFKKKK